MRVLGSAGCSKAVRHVFTCPLLPALAVCAAPTTLREVTLPRVFRRVEAEINKELETEGLTFTLNFDGWTGAAGAGCCAKYM